MYNCLILAYFVVWTTVGLTFEMMHARGSHCVMYGACKRDLDDTLSSTCMYIGSPKPLTSNSSIHLLQKYCSQIASDREVCCTDTQIENLVQTLQFPATLGFDRCPSCILNFRNLFCQLICSPRQSHFLDVTKTRRNYKYKDVVEEVNFHLSRRFVSDLYESCKDVQGRTMDKKAIDYFCKQGVSKCDLNMWLNFLGSTPMDGGYSPYQINFFLTDEKNVISNGQTFLPFTTESFKCSVSPSPNLLRCSCEDCIETCALINQEMENTSLTPKETIDDSEEFELQNVQLTAKDLFKMIRPKRVFNSSDPMSYQPVFKIFFIQKCFNCSTKM